VTVSPGWHVPSAAAEQQPPLQGRSEEQENVHVCVARSHACPMSQHAPPHTDSPVGQVHAPPTQVPLAQPFPHMPQLRVSVCSSTHSPLQTESPVGQQTPSMGPSPAGHAHLPAVQLSPEARHGWWHPPQWSMLVSRFTH